MSFKTITQIASPRLSPGCLALLALGAAGSAQAAPQQDPFAQGERWHAAPGFGATEWMPDDVCFAGDDAFVWASIRGGTRGLHLYDSVAQGSSAPRAFVPRTSAEFGVPLVAAGSRGDAVFALRQFEAPSAHRRAPRVMGFDPRMVSTGSILPATWAHDMGVRINGPVRLATDARGGVVVAAAWNDLTASVRIDFLSGTDGSLLGRKDLPAYSLNGLDVSADGSRIALTAGLTLYVFDADSTILHTQTLSSATQAVSLSKDGAALAFGELGKVNILAELPGLGYAPFQQAFGASIELPAAIDISDDGSLVAIAWWDYNTGAGARFEIYDTIFQFPLASLTQFALPGSQQNLPVAARISKNGYRAAFGLWGNGLEPEVVMIEAGAFGPPLQVDLPGSVRGLDLDESGTRIAVAHKDVHSQWLGSKGAVRLIDSGERRLQLTSTPSAGGALDAAAISPGSYGGWFILGPKADVPTQFPGVTGLLLLKRDELTVIPRGADATGRIDLSMALPSSSAIVGTQLHVQAAFRTTAGLAFTSNLVSPFVLP